MGQGGAEGFFGWKVVRAAFVAAVLGWGLAFYGLPVYLHELQSTRGWSISLVSAAATVHFLVGAVAVANMPAIYARLGVARTTRAGALLLGTGTLGWAVAAEPWQLFVATVASGTGWAATGAVAINAFVAPWFYHRRAAALSLAYNGASVGGILFPPLWVALIAVLGFPLAAALVALLATAIYWFLASRYFAFSPADLGMHPDGDAGGADAMARQERRFAPLPGRAMWVNPSFITYTFGFSVALFAQAGLIAHMFSLLVPVLGEGGAGYASSLAALCAVIGRTALGQLLRPDMSRRRAGALALVMQAAGCASFLAAGTTSAALMLLGVVLFGLGIGIAISIGPLIAQAEFSGPDTTRAIALATAVSQAAYAFAPAAFGLVRELSAAGEGLLYLVAGGIQLLAAAIYLQRPRMPDA